MKKIILIVIALLIGFDISAQEVVSSGGGTQSTAEHQISWTLGEVVIDTYVEGGSIITQGFHQTKLSLTPITELLLPNIKMNVFPNPTQDFIHIYFNELVKNTNYSLFDLSGKMLESNLILEHETS